LSGLLQFELIALQIELRMFLQIELKLSFKLI